MHRCARLPLPVGVKRAAPPAVTAPPTSCPQGELWGDSSEQAVPRGAFPLLLRDPLSSPGKPYTLGCVFPFHFRTCALGPHSLGNAAFRRILGHVPSARHIAHSRCFWKCRVVKKQIARTSQPPRDHFTFSQTIQKGLLQARSMCENNTFRCVHRKIR